MKNDLTISHLQKEQLPQAVAVVAKAFNVCAWRAKRRLRRTADGICEPTTLTATLEGNVVGVVQCHYYERQVSAIAWLAVDPAYRQLGIGHALVHEAEEEIRSKCPPGKDAIILLRDGTKAKNPSSRFYEKMGYVPEIDGAYNKEPLLGKKMKSTAFNVGIRYAF